MGENLNYSGGWGHPPVEKCSEPQGSYDLLPANENSA